MNGSTAGYASDTEAACERNLRSEIASLFVNLEEANVQFDNLIDRLDAGLRPVVPQPPSASQLGPVAVSRPESFLLQRISDARDVIANLVRRIAALRDRVEL